MASPKRDAKKLNRVRKNLLLADNIWLTERSARHVANGRPVRDEREDFVGVARLVSRQGILKIKEVTNEDSIN
jgi:hypothetical protein